VADLRRQIYANQQGWAHTKSDLEDLVGEFAANAFGMDSDSRSIRHECRFNPVRRISWGADEE
jgi:hypothetical protein